MQRNSCARLSGAKRYTSSPTPVANKAILAERHGQPNQPTPKKTGQQNITPRSKKVLYIDSKIPTPNKSAAAATSKWSGIAATAKSPSRIPVSKSFYDNDLGVMPLPLSPSKETPVLHSQNQYGLKPISLLKRPARPATLTIFGDTKDYSTKSCQTEYESTTGDKIHSFWAGTLWPGTFCNTLHFLGTFWAGTFGADTMHFI